MSTPNRPEDEDAAWRSIVDNYGERPRIDDPEADRDDLDSPVAGIEIPPSPRDLFAPRLPAEDDLARSREDPDEEHYVPPPPPPLPMPPPARLLAWVGLFGVPLFVLVALVVGVYVPSWLGLLLMVWFVGGFVFLVASMGRGPGEDHDHGDDGARL